jgi:biotin carboxyl carrier protein
MAVQTTLAVNPKELSKIVGRIDYSAPKPRPVTGGYESQWTAGHVERGGKPAVDIAIVEGSNVYSPMFGTVLRTNVMDSRGYGNLIEVQTPSGAIMYFAHLSKFLVQPGDQVQAGQLIGKTGNTWSPPGYSTGPHLHFAVQDEQGSWVEPEKFFGGGWTPAGGGGSNISLQKAASRMMDVKAAQEKDATSAYELESPTPNLSSPSSSSSPALAAAAGVVQSSRTLLAGEPTVAEGTTMVKIASFGALGDVTIPVRWPRLIAIGLGGVLLIIGMIGVVGKTYKVGTTGSYK